MSKTVIFCESGYNIFYGAQQSLYNFLVNADKKKFKMIVMCPGKGIFTEKLSAVNINVDIVEYPQVLNKTGNELRNNSFITKIKIFFGVLKYIRKQVKYLRSNKINLVYCNDIRSILTWGIAAKLTGIPVIWYIRIDKNLGIFNYIAANLADQIVLIANNIKNIFNKRYIFRAKKKFNTIYTGIDVELIDNIKVNNSLRSELGFQSDAMIVGMIASIQPRKGQKDFINAIIKLKKRKSPLLKNAKFLIIGDILSDTHKEYKDELKKLIDKNSLKEKVIFLGWRSDVINIMKQLDLVVLPSYSEGLPRTILESLACQCPVIATNVAGTCEIIKDKQNGLLIKPGDIDALANALEYVFSKYSRLQKMGEKGRKIIEEKFTMNNYVKNLQNLILKTIK